MGKQVFGKLIRNYEIAGLTINGYEMTNNEVQLNSNIAILSEKLSGQNNLEYI